MRGRGSDAASAIRPHDVGPRRPRGAASRGFVHHSVGWCTGSNDAGWLALQVPGPERSVESHPPVFFSLCRPGRSRHEVGNLSATVLACGLGMRMNPSGRWPLAVGRWPLAAWPLGRLAVGAQSCLKGGPQPRSPFPTKRPGRYMPNYIDTLEGSLPTCPFPRVSGASSFYSRYLLICQLPRIILSATAKVGMEHVSPYPKFQTISERSVVPQALSPASLFLSPLAPT